MRKTHRIELAKSALLGVSIGDAFGESFFGEEAEILKAISNRNIPETSWEFTDDTVMSISIFEQLERNGKIDPDELASSFVKNHKLDEYRGYGATARRVLREIKEGNNWKEVSQSVFDGMGSMGNGAAMRAAPIGAYFFDDGPLILENAKKSAEVTHYNIEGVCGAMAIAVAASLAVKIGLRQVEMESKDFIKEVCAELPDCDTKFKILKGATLSVNAHPETLRSILGNGNKMLAQDTVPVAIWTAAHHLYNFEEAVWKTIKLLGDRDTLCAMVGGIVILSAGLKTIPKSWTKNVENFETSVFRNTLRI